MPDKPCPCRDYSCSSSRDLAVLQIAGHHPQCPRKSRTLDNESIIGHLLLLLDRERDANAKLTARCNRMVATAAIEDVEWRPGK